MKRKRGIDTITDMLDKMHFKMPRVSAERPRAKIQTDRFKVGAAAVEDRLYSPDEVETLLEDRERLLYTKFVEFLRRDAAESSGSDIPRWVL